MYLGAFSARDVVRVVHGGRRAGPHPEHRRGRADHGAHDVQPRHLDPRRGAGVRLRPRHGRGARHGRGRLPRLLRALPGAAGRDHPQLHRVDARLGAPHGDGRGRARVRGRLGRPELALARDDGLSREPVGHDQGAPEPGPEPPRLRRRLQLAHVLRHGGLEDPAGQAPRLPRVGLSPSRRPTRRASARASRSATTRSTRAARCARSPARRWA